jgi:hypothetical protein
MTLAVFVPSVLGAGIIVSIAILVGDGMRRFRPAASAARADRRIEQQAVELVTPVARALGADPPTAPPLRELRGRDAYGWIALVLATASIYVGIGQTFNFLRRGGYLEGIIWVQAIAMAFSVMTFGLALVSLTLALRHRNPPRWTRWFVEHTPLGVTHDES